MTRIKLCGLSRPCDIKAANELMPDYIGFVFARTSKRYVDIAKALELRSMLDPVIKSVGVFVNEAIENIMRLDEVVNIIQLHGTEDENYIRALRSHTDKLIIKAFTIQEIHEAETSSADYILLDSGAGTGKLFDWNMINTSRPYFLAGGLTPDNIAQAVRKLKPFAVDVSSGIETNGSKDIAKMKDFVNEVRRVNNDKS